MMNYIPFMGSKNEPSKDTEKGRFDDVDPTPLNQSDDIEADTEGGDTSSLIKKT
jgi:hypothetical protein